MQQPNDGGPAFPRAGSDYVKAQEGMTLRDWLVGQALAGLCANDFSLEEHTKGQRAVFAVQQADEALKLLQEGFNRECN